LAVGYSAGSFGGGTNRTDLVPVHPEFGRIGARTDLDVMAYWTALNAGAGNVALRDRRLAERNLAVAEQTRMAAQIRREVTDAFARAAARRQEVVLNEQRLQIATDGYREDYRRIRGGVGLPIEILNSMNLLYQARASLIRATVGYDVAQFELFVALGQSPTFAPSGTLNCAAGAKPPE
jgi:outer membrane protein TolC